MKQFFVFLNHTLNNIQQQEIIQLDAKETLLPEPLRKKWNQIPPESSIKEVCNDFCIFLTENAKKDDYVLLQGEFGAVFYMADFCFTHSLIPVYAATKRTSVEDTSPDGTVEKKLIFSHRGFKRYMRYI